MFNGCNGYSFRDVPAGLSDLDIGAMQESK
jgi:hypothetical protein